MIDLLCMRKSLNVPHLFYLKRESNDLSLGVAWYRSTRASHPCALHLEPDALAEHWIHHSENILKKIQTLLDHKHKDRLERITAILFTLNVLDMSLHGWRGWVQNLNFMSHFSDEELEHIEDGLLHLTHAFVEYDVEITKKHQDKIPEALIAERERPEQRGGERAGLYV